MSGPHWQGRGAEVQGTRVLSVTYSLPHSSENWSQAHTPQLSRTSGLVAVNLAASANSVSPGVGDLGHEHWRRADGYFLSLLLLGFKLPFSHHCLHFHFPRFLIISFLLHFIIQLIFVMNSLCSQHRVLLYEGVGKSQQETT